MARLTERQRECLRLLYSHLGAKEIAIRLGISPGVVHEHLTAARRTLGTSRSVEAARMLHEYEAANTPYGVGGDLAGVGCGPDLDELLPANGATPGSADMVVREEVARYVIHPIDAHIPGPEQGVLRWLVRGAWVSRATLTTAEKLVLGLVSAFFATALFGALLAIQRALN